MATNITAPKATTTSAPKKPKDLNEEVMGNHPYASQLGLTNPPAAGTKAEMRAIPEEKDQYHDQHGEHSFAENTVHLAHLVENKAEQAFTKTQGFAAREAAVLSLRLSNRLQTAETTAQEATHGVADAYKVASGVNKAAQAMGAGKTAATEADALGAALAPEGKLHAVEKGALKTLSLTAAVSSSIQVVKDLSDAAQGKGDAGKLASDGMSAVGNIGSAVNQFKGSTAGATLFAGSNIKDAVVAGHTLYTHLKEGDTSHLAADISRVSEKSAFALNGVKTAATLALQSTKALPALMEGGLTFAKNVLGKYVPPLMAIADGAQFMNVLHDPNASTTRKCLAGAAALGSAAAAGAVIVGATATAGSALAIGAAAVATTGAVVSLFSGAGRDITGMLEAH